MLSELGDEWAGQVMRWGELNRPHRVELEDGQVAPDPSEELLLYQTMVGSWPDDAAPQARRDGYPKRLGEYLWKAIHEGQAARQLDQPEHAARGGGAGVPQPAARSEPIGRVLTDLNDFRRPDRPPRGDQRPQHEHWSAASLPACPTSTRGRSCGT
ncbi:MAG: hypothetical protein U0736_27110 [Gemmataceae bacterium]